MQSLYSMCDGSLCPLRELTHENNLVFKKERIFIVAFFFFFFTHNIIDILEDLFLFFYVEKLVSTSVAVTFLFCFFCILRFDCGH